MLVLASSSPRRAELLKQIGIEFTQNPANIDETPFSSETPTSLVERLARQKAESVWLTLEQKLPVIGSDTIGLLHDKILLKPKSKMQFIAMMQSMSGAVHQVLTSVAVCHDGKCESVCVITDVEFKPLSMADILWYWDTDEPKDKAGGYAIQGLGGQFVKQIKGSYSAVVGLPLFETTELLKKMDVALYER